MSTLAPSRSRMQEIPNTESGKSTAQPAKIEQQHPPQSQPPLPKQLFLHSMPLSVKVLAVATLGGGGGGAECCVGVGVGGAATPQRAQSASAQKINAKAMYDNVPDSPDELAFKKGDTLLVIEQNPDGTEGWWLCKLRDRQGLCPANRLRVLNSYDSGCFSPSPATSPCPSLAASNVTLDSWTNDLCENSFSGMNSSCRDSEASLLQQYRHSMRGSWKKYPNKALSLQRHGDVYRYNPSPTQSYQEQQPAEQIYSNQSIYQNVSMMSSSNGSSEFENYDIPKPATPVNYDCSKLIRPDSMSLKMKVGSVAIQEESYDVPRPLNNLLQHQHAMTPSSSNSSLQTSDSLSLSFSSNRSSLTNMPDYDVPRRNPLPVRAVQQLSSHLPHSQLSPHQQHQLQVSQRQTIGENNSTTYDFPQPLVVPANMQESASPKSLATPTQTKELPLELNSALDTLAKLQSEITNAITKLLSFVTPDWRQREKLEPVLMDVNLAVVRLRTALHDLTEFGEGALGNASCSEDRNLALKLRPHVRALRDANKLIRESSAALDDQGWILDQLSRNDDKFKTTCKPPDSLDQLIACAQTLTEDVRQTTSFIHGNASLLFKRNPIAAADQVDNSASALSENGINRSSAEWVGDYDYVSFESKDAAARKNSALREAIPANLQNNFDNTIKAAETTAIASSNMLPTAAKKNEVQGKDELLIRYYTVQISTHMGHLRQAIDSFLETVAKNQPPKFFIAYGKFVVVSAHNLVTIGDILHRNITKVELREKVLQCTNALSDALKTCVSKSKKAAAQFPSVNAVQEMVDSVTAISNLATDLQTVMLHGAQETI